MEKHAMIPVAYDGDPGSLLPTIVQLAAILRRNGVPLHEGAVAMIGGALALLLEDLGKADPVGGSGHFIADTAALPVAVAEIWGRALEQVGFDAAQVGAAFRQAAEAIESNPFQTGGTS